MSALPAPDGPIRRLRKPTSTATFGSSRRESHDASTFYDRFVPPEVSSDATVEPPRARDAIYVHDARDMGAVASNSIALVVTSPPYFAGKEYEESLGENGVPGSYFEYLTLLRDVFEECRAGPGAGRADRGQRREPRPASLPFTRRRRDRDPPGPGPAPARRGRVVEGPGGRRILRLGDVPAAQQPGAARRDRADRDRQQGSVRPGADTRRSGWRGACPRRRRSRGTSSSRRRRTCGRSHRRAPPGSDTPHPSRSSSPGA